MNRDEILLTVPFKHRAMICFHGYLLTKHALRCNAAHEDNDFGINDCELFIEMRLPVGNLCRLWRYLFR